MTQNRPRPRPWLAEALGRVAQIILETAERGCLSRSMFDKPKTRGISCAHSAIRQLRVGHPRSVPFGQHAPWRRRLVLET
jgi:hypothetical protein